MASRSKARPAFALLSLIAASLVIALVTCLPSEKKAPVETSTPAVPDTPAPARSEQAAAVAASPAPVETAHELKHMAVIIDDAGYSLADLQPYLDYPGPLAIAVLPNLPHSEETARRVIAAGKTLLLHCPMEPLNGENPGPGALRTDQTDDQLRALLESALATVPGAVGVNNHMGSKATADDRVMAAVFSFLREKGLFFVDSRTTVSSRAADAATDFAVPFLDRDVFIDIERSDEDLTQSISTGIAKASAKGDAVLIGHIHTPRILDILKTEDGAFREADIRLSDLAEIFEYRKGTGSEDTRN